MHGAILVKSVKKTYYAESGVLWVIEIFFFKLVIDCGYCPDLLIISLEIEECRYNCC